MKYNDVVVFVRNGVAVNALVVDSQIVLGEEHLRLAYLDPAGFGRSAVVMKQEFSVAPLKQGAPVGWEPLPRGIDVSNGFVVPMEQMLDLSNAIITNGGMDLIIPDHLSRCNTVAAEQKATEATSVPQPKPQDQEYPCGCKAGADCPNYCPEHGTPPDQPQTTTEEEPKP